MAAAQSHAHSLLSSPAQSALRLPLSRPRHPRLLGELAPNADRGNIPNLWCWHPCVTLEPSVKVQVHTVAHCGRIATESDHTAASLGTSLDFLQWRHAQSSEHTFFR